MAAVSASGPIGTEGVQAEGGSQVTVGTSAREGGIPDAVKGILWMLLTAALFMVMDVIAKWLSESYPTNQITWGRFFFHALFLGLYLNHRLLATLRSNRLGLQLTRSCLMLATNFLFFTGLAYLGLAEITAIMYVAPLVTTLLAVPLLGEVVGWRRIASVIVGFIGALIIIRPGSESLSWAVLFPLAAAFSHAAYQITTRMLSRSEGSLTTLAYTALVGAVISTLALPLGWETPDLIGWLGLMGMGLFGCLGHFTFIRAFTVADAALVSPFAYTSLLWASLFGYFLFSEVPDIWTIVGAAVVAGSGLYIVHRERQRLRHPVSPWRPSR